MKRSLLTTSARLRSALAAFALGLAGCIPASGQFELAEPLGSQEGATVSNTEVRSVSAGKCLATEGASTANGARTVIWTCNGSSAQQWTIPSVGFIGEVKLSNGRCLDVLNNATANSSAVGIWDCTGGNNQKWERTSAEQLRSVSANRCLDVYGNNTADGTYNVIYDCGTANNQKWRTATAISGAAVKSTSSAKCLATEGASPVSGTKTIIKTCDSSTNQNWTLPAVGTSGEVKHSSGRCLNVSGGSTANAASVIISDCDGSTHQQWNRTPLDELKGVASSRCADVNAQSTADGASIIIWDCSGQTNQKWTQGTSSSDQPLGGGAGWTRTFEDSFNGTSLDMTAWIDHESWENGGYGSGDWGWIRVPTPSTNLSVANGSVALKVRRESGLPTWTRGDGTVVQRTHTTAHISTKNKQVVPANTVSYIEARMKVPDNNCTLPSLWLLGNGTWSTTGEVDILEFFNNASEKGMPAYTVHYPRDVWTNPPGTAFNDVWVTHPDTLVTRSDLPNTWHTWGLYRDSTKMELRIDGVLIATLEPNKSYPTWDNHNIRLPPMLFTNDMNIRLSYGVGGHQSSGLTNSQCVDGDFLIDYVRVWRK